MMFYFFVVDDTKVEAPIGGKQGHFAVKWTGQIGGIKF
jgi:hypothetical protein